VLLRAQKDAAAAAAADDEWWTEERLFAPVLTAAELMRRHAFEWSRLKSFPAFDVQQLQLATETNQLLHLVHGFAQLFVKHDAKPALKADVRAGVPSPQRG
jgi:hypothetical protein